MVALVSVFPLRIAFAVTLTCLACARPDGRAAPDSGADLYPDVPHRTGLRRDVVGCYDIRTPAGTRLWPQVAVVLLDSLPPERPHPGIWRLRTWSDTATKWSDDPWSAWRADSTSDSVRVNRPYGLGTTLTVFAGSGKQPNGRTASFSDVVDEPPADVGPVRATRVPCPR